MVSTITNDRFAGYPVNTFRAEERRSLTVHLEDAGKIDVFANEDANSEGSGPVFAGRFDTWGAALTVCDGLNRVWKAAPQATAAEIVAFVGRDTEAADAVRMLRATLKTLCNRVESQAARLRLEVHPTHPDHVSKASAAANLTREITDAREVLANCEHIAASL